MIGSKDFQDHLQIVCSRDDPAKFLEQSLQVFLGRLLTMEADRVVENFTIAGRAVG